MMKNPIKMILRYYDSILGHHNMWIALGTVLEWFYTFWLFLIHWLAFPYRYLKKHLS